MSTTSPPKKHHPRQQRIKTILHVSIQGRDHSLPSSIDVFELHELFSEFKSEIISAVIISSPELQRAGKVTFKSISVSSTARAALHGMKLEDGNSLKVRFWRNEDDSQSSMVPGACSPTAPPPQNAPRMTTKNLANPLLTTPPVTLPPPPVTSHMTMPPPPPPQMASNVVTSRPPQMTMTSDVVTSRPPLLRAPNYMTMPSTPPPPQATGHMMMPPPPRVTPRVRRSRHIHRAPVPSHPLPLMVRPPPLSMDHVTMPPPLATGHVTMPPPLAADHVTMPPHAPLATDATPSQSSQKAATDHVTTPPPPTPPQSSQNAGSDSKDLEDPVLRTLYVKINNSQSPDVQPVKKKDLWSHFDQFQNDIETISPIIAREYGGFAFVTFKTRKAALKAIRCFDGSSLHGCHLNVSFKKVKKATSAVQNKEPIASEVLQRADASATSQRGAANTPSKSKSAGRKEPVITAQKRSVKEEMQVFRYDQIILDSYYDLICTSPEMEKCKESLTERFKADITTCYCRSSPSDSSVVSQACLQVSKDHVVTLKIVVGSLDTEKSDAVVIPTGRLHDNSYSIALTQPSLKVGPNGRFSTKLFNSTFMPLVEIGQTDCIKAEHLLCSHIIQVLLPFAEQMSSDNLSCSDSIRNSLSLAAQNHFGSIAFPGIRPQSFVDTLVTCLTVLGSTSLHTVSVVLGTLSEAKKYKESLSQLVSGSTESGDESKKTSDVVRRPSSASTTPTSPSSSDYVWSWRENDGTYIQYTPELTKALNAEYKKDRNSTYFANINGTRYSINFGTMKQTNLLSQYQRPIRKTPQTTSSCGSNCGSNCGSIMWKYRDDHGYLTPYSSSDSAEIEALYQKKDEFTYLIINKRTYRFNFTARKQVNVMTGYERDIDRETSSTESESKGPRKPVFLCDGEVILNIKCPQKTLAILKQTVKNKLKSLLFSKTIPYPASSNQSLLKKIQEIAKQEKVGCTVGEGGVEASSLSKQVLTIQGLKSAVGKAQTAMQEVMLAYHSSFDQLPKAKSADQYPTEWEPMTAAEQFKLANLSHTSLEFVRVRRRFEETMSSSDYTIVKIQQVQNKILWTKYQQSKVRLHNKDPLMVNEKELFHGTRNKPASVICSSEDGFDMRHSREGMWGQANYFAVKANYSDPYSYHDDDKQTNEMILAKVLTGDSYSCGPDSTLRMPPEKKRQEQGGMETGQLQQVRYDSVNGVTHGSKVFMTYTNDLSYPAFIITYVKGGLVPPRAVYQPPPPQPSYQPPQPSYQPAQPSYQPAQPSYQPAQPSYQPAQPSYQPAQLSYQSTQPSYQPAQLSYQPSYQPAQPSYQPAQPSYQPAQPSYQVPPSPRRSSPPRTKKTDSPCTIS